MNAVPDRQLDDPRQDEEMMPEQALDDGMKEAADDFFEYMISADQRDELYDFLMSQANHVVIRANIKRWSEELEGKK